jgi:hypothetical protein
MGSWGRVGYHKEETGYAPQRLSVKIVYFPFPRGRDFGFFWRTVGLREVCVLPSVQWEGRGRPPHLPCLAF